MLKRKLEADAKQQQQQQQKQRQQTKKTTSVSGVSTASLASTTPTASSTSSDSSTTISQQTSRKRTADELENERAQKKQKLVEHKDVSRYLNKQRTLVLCSRGTSFRGRHLMDDMLALMPHGKKENKLDSKHDFSLLNELAVLKNCNNVIFFETRKRQDVYMWISKAPNGPSAKFLVQNAHTMAETKLTGNCLRGSRPLLVFDGAFSSHAAPDGSSSAGPAHLQLLKELFTQTMGSPKGHPKVQPFIDHVFSFFYADNRIWFRNYQIVYEGEKVTEVEAGADPSVARNGNAQPMLVEIGPRFVLNPIRIFGGSFGGPTLWENPHYVSPNELRSRLRRMQGEKYLQRKQAEAIGRAHKEAAQTADHPVDEVFQEGRAGARMDLAALEAAQASSVQQAVEQAMVA